MRQIKVILKFIDEFDREFNKECMKIDEFLFKIDRAIENDFLEFDKAIKIKFSISDENDKIFTKENCTLNEFKKESIKLKAKLE
jgi:hypothetical protein